MEQVVTLSKIMKADETIKVTDLVRCPSLGNCTVYVVEAITGDYAEIRPMGCMTSLENRKVSIERLNRVYSPIEPPKPEKPAKKPPMGIRSRQRMDEDRFGAIQEAIRRYENDDFPVPPEWIEERNEIFQRLNKYYGVRSCGNSCLKPKE